MGSENEWECSECGVLTDDGSRCNHDTKDEVEELRAENARLRAVIGRVRYRLRLLDEPGNHYNHVDAFTDIRAALDPNGDNGSAGS